MLKLTSVFLLLILSSTAIADSITSFNAKIILGERTNIEEKITLNQISNNKYIGIPRSISLLSDQSEDLKILEAKNNNEDVKYETHRFYGNTFSIVFGDRNKLLPSGAYDYSLRYELDTLSRVNDDKKILEYSVNSEFWKIPINNISAKVILPSSFKNIPIKHQAYTFFDGKKDLTTSQSSVTAENNQLVVNFNCLKSLEPGEEFYIYLEYPNTEVSVSKGITAEASETVTINGKTVKVGKSITAGGQSLHEPEVVENTEGTIIKIDGKEIKVGKAIKLDQAPEVKKEIPAATQSDKIKIDGKEIKLGNTIQLNEQKEAALPSTTTPSGKKVEVGKSVRIEE